MVSEARKPSLYFVAGQISAKALEWAYPGMSFDEILYDGAAEYLAGKAGIEDPEEVQFVVEAAKRGFEKRKRNPKPGDTIRYWVSARPVARGGWLVKRVKLDAQGREIDGGVFSEEKTKAEAKRVAALANLNLREQKGPGYGERNPKHWSLTDLLLLPGPGLLEEEITLAGALVNPLPPHTADTMSEAIALSSPSGHMSRRARAAAQARLGRALFGEGGIPRAFPPKEEERDKDLRWAKEYRTLASRGMSVRKFTRMAEELEKKWGVQNPASWTLDPRHVLRYGTVMRHPHAAASRAAGRKIPAGKPARYKGVLIFPAEGGFATSLERESIFDTAKDAKRFIDTQKRNPRRRRRIR